MTPKMVVDMDNPNCCKEMAQDMMEDRFHEHINRETANRKIKAVREAQERARAAKKIERMERTFKAIKWKHTCRLAVTALVLGGLAYAHSFDLISTVLYRYVFDAALIYFGWCLSNTIRLLRGKPRIAKKGCESKR